MENADVLFTEDRKLRVELKFIERHEEENIHLDYLPYLLHRNVTSLQHIAIGEYKGLFTWKAGAPAKRVTRLTELPWASQLFIRFFRKRIEVFTC